MEKKRPIRKCIACREHREKRDLIRLVKGEDGSVVIDPTQKKNGRGAYLCRSEDCYAKARKQQALERALKAELSEDLYRQIEEELGRVDIE